MDEKKLLVEKFEASRRRLHNVAYRMLGSASEAEDAVQEAWLRLARSDPGAVENLGGWLTTVVARVCLDMLRARKSRREEHLETSAPEPTAAVAVAGDPEREIALADSVGVALMLVLDALSPAERLAFVLHDMFDVPFEEIAPIVGRTPTAARQLASRARRRVQGARTPVSDFTRRRKVVEAFLAASRGGDFEALLAVLDPNVVFRADAAAVRLGSLAEIRGASAVAQAFQVRRAGTAARPAVVDGAVGVAIAPAGKLLLVLRLTITDGRIAGIEAIADPERLAALDLMELAG
jgi:RNA polymerase sigma-70 factor (ECF subfamily)